MATAAGFVGVLIMVAPTGEGLNIYGLLVVLGALAAALVMIILRRLSQTDAPGIILTYQVVAIGLLTMPFALVSWVPLAPRAWALLALIGVLSFCGQMGNINGFRHGEASAIAPLDYMRLLFAAALGYFVFAETLGWRTIVGAAMIIGASLYTLHREARLGRLRRTPRDGTTPRI